MGGMAGWDWLEVMHACRGVQKAISPALRTGGGLLATGRNADGARSLHPWDAQKDMALAAAGAIIALTATAMVNRKYQRDFTREWTDSLRIHPPQ